MEVMDIPPPSETPETEESINRELDIFTRTHCNTSLRAEKYANLVCSFSLNKCNTLRQTKRLQQLSIGHAFHGWRRALDDRILTLKTDNIRNNRADLQALADAGKLKLRPHSWTQGGAKFMCHACGETVPVVQVVVDGDEIPTPLRTGVPDCVGVYVHFELQGAAEWILQEIARKND